MDKNDAGGCSDVRVRRVPLSLVLAACLSVAVESNARTVTRAGASSGAASESGVGAQAGVSVRRGADLGSSSGYVARGAYSACRRAGAVRDHRWPSVPMPLAPAAAQAAVASVAAHASRPTDGKSGSARVGSQGHSASADAAALRESAAAVEEAANGGNEKEVLDQAFDNSAALQSVDASAASRSAAFGRARLTLAASREDVRAVSGKTETILVTGFEPFGGSPDNVSGDVARRLDGGLVDVLPGAGAASAASFQIVSLVLPVSYERAAAAIIEAISRLRPSVVMMTGLSGRTASIEIEKQARNWISAEGFPDADGRVHNGVPILAQTPDAVVTELPTGELSAVLSESGHPAVASDDAGGFVCNSTYYCALLAAKAAGTTLTPVFLHLPPASEHLAQADREAMPHWPLEMIFSATEKAARWLAIRAADAAAKTVPLA